MIHCIKTSSYRPCGSEANFVATIESLCDSERDCFGSSAEGISRESTGFDSRSCTTLGCFSILLTVRRSSFKHAALLER